MTSKPRTRLPSAAPPRAQRQPTAQTVHQDLRVDEFGWLRDPGYPEVTRPEILAYLNEENAYLAQALAPVEQLEAELFDELCARVAQDDDSVPLRKGGYWYQTRFRAGHEYPTIVRWAEGQTQADAVCLLDLNQLAAGREYLELGDFAPSPDQACLAYSLDLDGSERHEVRFLRLPDSELSDVIPGTQGELVWSADGQWVFYAELDAQLRPSRVYRHRVGSPVTDDQLVYEETDPGFWLSLGQTADEAFILIASSDKQTSEVRLLRSAEPQGTPQVVCPRREGHEYDVEHHFGKLLIRTNDQHKNFRVVSVEVGAGEPDDFSEQHWQELLPASDSCYIRDLLPFERHLAVLEREAGLPEVRIVDLASRVEHRVEFPDPVYTVGFGDNAEFRSDVLRLEYQSLVSPPSVLDYDMLSRSVEVKKRQVIPSGYEASEFASERVFAEAEDGARIPVSLVYKKSSPPSAGSPLYLYVYGSYGITVDPYFSPNRLSLLSRGFVFAIAHVRGGSIMGREWYEQGKLMHKLNTFSDILAVARHLAEKSYTSLGRITVSGGSAGGLAVGAVLNQAPEYFHAAVASVPFVDCLNTMLDSSLPLTPPEYTEWGNPEADPEVYRYMLRYSPYDNVKAQGYPHTLVTAGIADPRVTYWEPAKWVAKLRALKTDENLLVLHTNMTAGHGGASGRFEALRELAREYAFLLWVYAHPEAQPRASVGKA